MDKNWEKFLKQKREDYNKMGCIDCPAFGGEKIYFTSAGFRHILRKSGQLRSEEEQLRRFNLLSFVKSILSTSTMFTTTTINLKMRFWSFQRSVNNKTITVIIRQAENGPKHFYSIFDH